LTEACYSDRLFTADCSGCYGEINRLDIDYIILVAMIVNGQLLKYASVSCKSRSKQSSMKGMFNCP